MHYLYLLHSKKTNSFYIGTTSDLFSRSYHHNAGENASTRRGIPWKMVYFEAYPTKTDALRRERKLKQYGQALRQIKARITVEE